MRAYSPDLRATIVAAVDGGMNKAQAARTLGVGRETIRRYVQLQRQIGALNPRPHPGRRSWQVITCLGYQAGVGRHDFKTCPVN